MNTNTHHIIHMVLVFIGIEHFCTWCSFVRLLCILCEWFLFFVGFFFFKQKTAYEMRISDWSSDVCSSDLMFGGSRAAVRMQDGPVMTTSGEPDHRWFPPGTHITEIGRASCRERVCQYV